MTDVEPTRLELARRLDWRFLLTNPALGRVLLTGDPDPDLRRAIGAFAASIVTGDLEQAEIVISHRPSPAELRTAIERVLPGGSIVVELVGRSRPGQSARLTAASAEAVVERLRHAAFEDVAAYWTWPDQQRCLEVVPLDEPALVRLALARRRGSRTSLNKARLARLLFRTGAGPALLDATVVVGRRPSATAGPVGTGARRAPLVDAFVDANRVRLGIAGLGVEPPRSLLITPRFEASAHVVALVAPRGSDRPLAVVKVQRLPDGAGSLDGEASTLRALSELDGGSPGVPRLLSAEPVGGHPAIVETALIGRPLDPLEVRRDRAAAVGAVGRWVRGLRRASTGRGRDERSGRLIRPALDTLSRVLADDPADLELVKQAGVISAPLAKARLPVSIEHGDLSHPNLIRLHDGPEPRIGAIDWELGEPNGFPLVDFLFFLGYVALATGGRPGEPVPPVVARDLVVGSFTGGDAWAATAAARQADAEGIDRQLLAPLLVTTWTRTLAGLVGRLGHDGGGPRTAGQRLRAHRYHAIWAGLVASAPSIVWSDRG